MTWIDAQAAMFVCSVFGRVWSCLVVFRLEFLNCGCYGLTMNKKTKEIQKITSAGTSRRKVPKTYRLVKEQLGGWKRGSRNLDIGCGQYPELFTEALNAEGVINYAYDPYWLPNDSNQIATDWAIERGFDTVTVNNVLNVVDQDGQVDIIDAVADYLKSRGTAYFLFYEGDKTGVGRKTRDGWQENRRARSYMSQIVLRFDEIVRRGNLIIARRPHD